MKEIVKNLIKKEIGEHEDNLYRAKLVVHPNKIVIDYIKYHEAKIKELEEILNDE